MITSCSVIGAQTERWLEQAHRSLASAGRGPAARATRSWKFLAREGCLLNAQEIHDLLRERGRRVGMASAVVVAMIAVWMVQVPVDEIVDVVTVGHRLVAAAGSVLVPGLVHHGGLPGCAAVRVLGVDRDPVLIHVTLVRMVQMPVVKIVGMPIVANREMTAVRPVLVIVAAVDGVTALSHPGSFLELLGITLDPAPGVA